MKRLVALLTPLVMLAACGPSPQAGASRLLDHRLQTQLAPAIANGRAVLQPLPDGARVTLMAPTMFANGRPALDDLYPEIRASVIEGLLDPSLMRVEVADTSTLPDDQRVTREQNVIQYFTENGLGSVLRAPEPQTVPGPAGLAITISVHCPKPNGFIGYGDGRSRPVCG